jgi:excisionase family DNA binding protein
MHTSSLGGKTMNQPDTMSVEEVARRLGISRNGTYDACRRGEIPCLRIGRRIVIPRVAFERFMAKAEADVSDPTAAAMAVRADSD